MTQEQIQEITDYLCGDRDHYAGSVLYTKYGPNLRLRNLFAVDDSRTSHEMMIYELHKLAGVTPAEIALLPKISKEPEQTAAVGRRPEPEAPAAVSPLREAPPEVRRQAALRDSYPFLGSPDCSDELKVAVADMISAHADYVQAHAGLQAKGDGYDADCPALAEQTVERYLANRRARHMLEHYKATGELPDTGERQEEVEAHEDITSLSDLDLKARYDSAGSQVSKLKRQLAEKRAKGADTTRIELNLDSWTLKKQTYKAEIDRRRKVSSTA